MIFATGDAGFVQSKFVLRWRNATDEFDSNFDKLHYAGNLNNLEKIKNGKCLQFAYNEISENLQVLPPSVALQSHALIHVPAETHLDPSVFTSDEFVVANTKVVISLIETDHRYWSSLPGREKSASCLLLESAEEAHGASSPREVTVNGTVGYVQNVRYTAQRYPDNQDRINDTRSSADCECIDTNCVR